MIDGKLLPAHLWKKLPNYVADTLDQYEKRREKIVQAKETAEDQLRQIDNIICADVAETALGSDNDLVKAYGEALLHQQLGIVPKRKKLGYTIADASTNKLKVKDRLLVEMVCCFLDKTTYVFSRTHYDEMSGDGVQDHYFRRS